MRIDRYELNCPEGDTKKERALLEAAFKNPSLSMEAKQLMDYYVNGVHKDPFNDNSVNCVRSNLLISNKEYVRRTQELRDAGFIVAVGESDEYISPSDLTPGLRNAIDWVARDARLTPQSKGLYLFFLNLTLQQYEESPGYEAVHGYMQMSPDTYARHLKPLLQHGYVTIKREKEGSHYKKNQYVLTEFEDDGEYK